MVLVDDFRTALMLAAEKGNTALCDYLINNGADVALLDINGAFFFLFVKKISLKISPHQRDSFNF